MASLSYQLFKSYCLNVLGNICATCGSSESLEIDHVTESTKSFNISRSWMKVSKEDLDQELTKCQALCYACHKIKSGAACSVRKQKDRSLCHGTLSQYNGYKCRCPLCIEAYSVWKKAYRVRKHGSYTRGPYKRKADMVEFGIRS